MKGIGKELDRNCEDGIFIYRRNWKWNTKELGIEFMEYSLSTLRKKRKNKFGRNCEENCKELGFFSVSSSYSTKFLSTHFPVCFSVSSQCIRLCLIINFYFI